MRSFVLLVLVVIVLVKGDILEIPSYRLEQFERWTIVHNKSYGSKEEHMKRAWMFSYNMDYVEGHNAKKAGFEVAMNQFGDLTVDEFSAIYNGFRPDIKSRTTSTIVTFDERISAPSSMDWRTKNCVTPVKDQGQCGSCWSFSATGSIEGQHALTTGKLISLSEENLLDCSWSFGNYGCKGGFTDHAFQYVVNNNGIDTEESYPYALGQGSCKYSSSNLGATVNSYMVITSGSEEQLLLASGLIGPISVAIDASHQSFQFYKSGIYYEPACSPRALDHAVLVVGYGESEGQQFWSVKNSWGVEHWGDQGYIYMARNRSNNCGIATQASYPVLTGTTGTAASENSGSVSASANAAAGGTGGRTGGTSTGTSRSGRSGRSGRSSGQSSSHRSSGQSSYASGNSGPPQSATYAQSGLSDVGNSFASASWSGSYVSGSGSGSS